MGVAFTLGFLGIFLVIFLILLGILLTGLILLIIGIVSGRACRKKGVVKKYPKVLMVLGSILIIIPILWVVRFLWPSNEPSSEEMYEQQQVQVIEAFKNRDTVGLKDTFLTNRQTDHLEKDIQKAFSYIEGDIVSYEHLESERSGLGSGEEGMYDEYEGGYGPVETSTGKQYTIYIFSVINLDEEERSGVERIVVEEVTSKKKKKVEQIEID